MSIDFMVFDPAVAPRSPRAFRTWYREQTDWPDNDDCWNPSIAAPAIRSWYSQMVKRFPDANQPDVVPQVVDDTYGDYNFSRDICYVAFRPRVADDAWALVQSFAAEHDLGTYDPNSDDERNDDCIRFPDGPLSSDPPRRRGLLGLLSRF